MLSEALHPKLAHIIPNFQNPAGYTLSAAKRARLLELAVEHDFTIFEDDPYVAIRFEGEPIASLCDGPIRSALAWSASPLQ